jgi:hypothetical protein
MALDVKTCGVPEENLRPAFIPKNQWFISPCALPRPDARRSNARKTPLNPIRLVYFVIWVIF